MSGDGEAEARALDAADPLTALRDRFHLPLHAGREAVYLCGNSLGLQPRAVRAALEEELEAWARLGVEGHFHAPHPWYPAHEPLRPLAADLVGAQPHEVVVMNSLTVNLHLLMVSFYRPTPARPAIAIDLPCFPSDVYAVKSQLRLHGRDPEGDLVRLEPRPGEQLLRTEDVLERLEREGHRLALVLLGGVNYFTGQLHDLAAIARAARAHGCLLGLDLAHAAGNVPLRLHEWGVDFAAWCSYKYLNAGPGAVAGAFVHERHLGRGGAGEREAFRRLPRLEGWWGNDPATRFAMGPEFEPVPSADAWQLSNPPVLAMTPVRVSLELFAEAGGMGPLRAKSLRLTGYLEEQVRALGSAALELITPADPAARGCQLSLRVRRDPEALFARLQAAGVICDLRRPDVIRVAPVPLYNSFHDCWRFARVLAAAAGGAGREGGA